MICNPLGYLGVLHSIVDLRLSLGPFESHNRDQFATVSKSG